jgi:gliding motility-associated-like protein
VLHADDQVVSPSYVLWRSENTANGFAPLDTVTTLQADIFFTDDTADPHSGQWFYMIEVLDSCGFSAYESDVASSLFLQAGQLDMFSNLLEWHHQPSWGGGVMEYELWRRLPLETEFTSMQVLGGNTTSYVDNLDGIPPDLLSGNVYYRLSAREGSGNPFGFQESVVSNIAAVPREEEIFVPNAFRPASNNPLNRTFKPALTFVGNDGYRLMVFNRWGQEIFTSTDPQTGWDGTENGRESPPGVYAWVIRYLDATGGEKEKRGVVKLLR